MPLTGTVDNDNARIDLFVDFTDQAGTQTFATVFRRVGNINAPDQYVRGLFGTTLLGEQAYVSDHEAPLDKQIWYVAIGGDPTATMTAGPFTISSAGFVWMKDPGRPWADLRLDLCENPDDGRDPCPAVPAVTDTFTRTLAASWGSTDTGQVWTNTGGAAADYSVSGTRGQHTHPAVNTAHSSTLTATSTDQEVVVDTGVSATAVGDSLFSGPLLRRLDVNNYYWARLTFRTDGSLQLALRERVAGVETGIGTIVTLPFGYVPNQMFRIRFRVEGSVIQARVWPADVAEGSEWDVTVTDSSLTLAGSVGVRSLAGSASTVVSPVFSYDNFSYSPPELPTDDLAWVGFQDKERASDAGLFPVLDFERPADVYARRKDITTSWLFLSRSRPAIDLVYELYTAGGPLLLQVPDVYHMNNQYGITDRYYQPGDLTEAYLSRDQRRPPRLWSAPVVAVNQPVGLPQGTDTANWCAMAQSYATFADLTATGYTWSQVATGAATTVPTSTLYGGGLYGDGIYGG